MKRAYFIIGRGGGAKLLDVFMFVLSFCCLLFPFAAKNTNAAKYLYFFHHGDWSGH
jgi:hypothetical protein